MLRRSASVLNSVTCTSLFFKRVRNAFADSVGLHELQSKGSGRIVGSERIVLSSFFIILAARLRRLVDMVGLFILFWRGSRGGAWDDSSARCFARVVRTTAFYL